MIINISSNVYLIIFIISSLVNKNLHRHLNQKKDSGNLYEIKLKNKKRINVDTRLVLHNNKQINKVYNIKINDFINTSNKLNIIPKLVTIIVPVYNASITIHDTIGSLINQTYNNIEIIIINDASTDDSLVKLQQINDDRIKIYNNDINYGTYISINIGLKVSLGEYILLQGSDDYSTINRVEKMVNCLSTTNYTMCYSNWIRGFNNQKNIEGNFMFKKNILNTLGYFDNTRIAGDTEFIKRYKLKYGDDNIFYINDILNVASVHNNSLTHKKQTGIKSINRLNYRISFLIYHRSIKKTKNYYMPFLYTKNIYKLYDVNKIKNKKIKNLVNKKTFNNTIIKNNIYINDIGFIIQ